MLSYDPVGDSTLLHMEDSVYHLTILATNAGESFPISGDDITKQTKD